MRLSLIKELLTSKMRNRYRLIIRNDVTLEKKISVVLTPLNVVLIFSGLLVIFMTIAIFLLPITPMRYFMPGGGEVNPKDFSALQQRIDSFERVIRLKQERDSNLLELLRGDEVSWMTVPSYEPIYMTAGLGMGLSEGSSEAAQTSKTAVSLKQEGTNLSYLPRGHAFYTPLKGVVTDTFNLRNNHTAVDIVSYTNAAVKSTLDGTVVLSTWTPETGHVMLIQHEDNLLSVYKHNAVLLKKSGAKVSAGEVIALMGNSGELTSGPHLHFELWYNGQAVNPQHFIRF